MFVIPLVLTEETAGILQLKHLQMLAACSTDVVREKVIKYLNNPEADSMVKEKVREAYASYILRDEYLENPETINAAKVCEALSYESVNASLSVNELNAIRQAIDYILKCDVAVPYIKPIESALVKDLIKELENGYKDISVSILVKAMNKNKILFRDTRKVHRGTVVKRVIRDKRKYEILRRGIDFLLEKKQRGAMASEWRHL